MNHTFHLPDSSVFLGPLAETLPAWLRNRQYEQFFIITDRNTHAVCSGCLQLPGAVEFVVGGIGHAGTAGFVPEQLKTLQTCEQIWAAMLGARLDRRALVINLGGGVISDMGGFCAATYKRGLDFVQLPTSLLAMTDAAIGGKLGIDFHGVKNAIGVFKNPVAVFADPDFLKSLPARELRSGFAEIIKHALIGDPALWQKIQSLHPESIADGAALSAASWIDLLEASISVKTQVVTLDPHEHGIRALLNFGHTFGHAIESYFLPTADPLTHGEAVAMGMLCEALPSDGAGAVFPFEQDAEILRIIPGFFPCRPIPESAFPAIWDLMLQDKKNKSGVVRLALPDAEPFSMRLQETSRADVERRLRRYNVLLAAAGEK